MASPNVIVFSAENVEKVPMLADNNVFTGTNTFSGSTVLNGALSGTSVKDEDTMTSDSATAVPTQQSTKAYVDAHASDTSTHGVTTVAGIEEEQIFTNKKFGDETNYATFAADGELTLAGTARVYKVIALRPSGFGIPGTKPATSVDHGIGLAWEFSDATDDTVEAEMQLPQDMDRTVAPEFNIGWDSDTADPGDDSKQCVWQLEYLYLSLNEDVTAAAQETLTVTASASTTANGLVVSTITGLDLPSATDRFMMIRLKRLGADGDDDLGDVAYLNGCGFKYTSSKLGLAL